MKTTCIILRDASEWSMGNDPKAGMSIAEAVNRFGDSQQREPIHSNHGVYGWVIGSEVNDTFAVYVVQENDGEKVTSRTGSQAALNAMVNVLRGHGYTCVKRSGS